jgi:multidrug efflux system membrane fusion protein
MFQENESRFVRRNLKRAAIVACCVLGVVLVIGAYSRFTQASSLNTWTHEEDVPTVSVISPLASGKSQALTLPGTLQAYYDAPIYSRVPGYVHDWYKDIGARVKQGDLLATVDTPELDQQISQARADVGAAVSAEKLSATTAQRWNSLLPLDAVSKQDAEEKEEDLAAKTGAVKAAQANLDRLQAMKSFARIVAPFDGVVTKRNVDRGDLVNAGPANSGDPLFAVSSISTLRVYVNVPQSYSAQIVPNMTVSLSVPEYPAKTFQAKLVSTSNAISERSAALLVEFQVNNSDGLLKPGDYALVSMGMPQSTTTLRLPASALMFRSAGLQVATVGRDDRIATKSITIGTDMGTQVTVAAGLDPRDRVVNNPPDSLSNGDKVRVGTDAD